MKFRLADKITGWEKCAQIRGVKAVSFEEYCLKTPMGDVECLPESLIMESFFQFAGWLTILSTGYSKTCLVQGWENMVFNLQLKPGQKMMVSVTAKEFTGERIVFDAVGIRDGQEIAKCRDVFAEIYPVEAFFDPADLKTLYSEIYQPNEK